MSINWKRYTLGALLLAAFALLLFGCGGGGGSSASGPTKSLSGVVSDPQSGLPLANAKVTAYAIDANGTESAAALSNTASTDTNGAYTVQIPQSYNGSVMVEASLASTSVHRQLKALISASGSQTIKAAVPQSVVAQAVVPPVMVSLATDTAVEFVGANYAGVFSSDSIRKANLALEALFGANFSQTPPPASGKDLNTSRAQQDLIVSIKALSLVIDGDNSKIAAIVASMVATGGMQDNAAALQNGIAQALIALNAAGTLPPEYQPNAVINTALANAQSAPLPVPNVSDVTAPSTPVVTAATAPVARRVIVTWNASQDDVGVAGYAVCRALGTGSYQVIDTVDATGSSATSFAYIDEHVAAKTAYSYKIVAFDAARNRSLPSDAVSVTTPAAADAIAPAMPAALVCKGFTSTQANLQWPLSVKTSADGTIIPAAKYNVYRNYQLVATTTGTTFVDTALLPGTTYTYFVKASDLDGNISAASPVLNVHTAASSTSTPPAPASALGLSSAATFNRVQLAWTKSASTSTSVTYNVYRDSQLIASGITGVTYIDGAVLQNTSYLYTVTAVDGSAESAATAALAVTTAVDANATDTAAPTMPNNLMALSATSKTVSLTWSPSFKMSGADNIVAGYVIYRGSASATNFVKVGVSKTPGFIDTTVAPSTTYSYQIKAFSSTGVLSPASKTWIVITPAAVDVTDTTPPTVPGDLALAADASVGAVPLKWTASTKSTGDGVVAGYLVYRDGALISDVKGPSFTDNSVVSGKTYVYTVRAYDNPGNVSAASTGLTVSTPAATPGVYSIYGSVVVNGTGLPGVPVTLTSSTSTTVNTVTDANGNYSFINVADNTRYSVTAAATGYYGFTPASYDILVSGANVTGKVFSATMQGALDGSTSYPDGVIIGGVSYPGGTVIGGVLFPTGTVIGGVSYPAGSIVGGIVFVGGSVTGSTQYPTGGVSGGIVYPYGGATGAAIYPTGSITGSLSW